MMDLFRFGVGRGFQSGFRVGILPQAVDGHFFGYPSGCPTRSVMLVFVQRRLLNFFAAHRTVNPRKAALSIAGDVACWRWQKPG